MLICFWDGEVGYATYFTLIPHLLIATLLTADVEDKGLQQTAAFLTSFIRYVCFALFHFLAQLVATVRHRLFCRVLCVGSVDGGRTLCWRYCAVFGGWRAAPV